MGTVRKVNPNCVNAGNPFHQCGGYCGQRPSQSQPKLRINGGGKSSGRDADPNCVNASNPFHKCAGYCLKKTVDSKKPASVRVGGSVGVERRNVDPSCVKASNPFHQCGDSCNKNATIATKQIGTSKTVQNGELRKEEIRKMEEARHVDPACANASNPFHKCTNSCSQRTPGATRRTNGHTSEITLEPPQVMRRER